MILTGKKIEEEVLLGNIMISEFDKQLLNPNSYNYCLGDELIEIYLDDKNIKKRKIKIPNTGYILYPKRLYLGSTHQKIGSKKYATSLIGRSSIGRLGLHVQLAANLGHTGIYHSWTLEIRVCLPIIVYPRMKIGQVSFWENYGEVSLHEGVYSKFSVPKEVVLEKIYLEEE